MRNLTIRKTLQAKGLRLWQLGVVLGKSEPSITRMMRSELPAEEQQRICSLIEEYKETQCDQS